MGISELGRFESARFSFLLDDGDAVLQLAEPMTLIEEDLQLSLAAHPALHSALNGAPLASWVLARLAALVGPLGVDPTFVEVLEEAVWVLDFVVEDSGGTQLAKLQLQGGQTGVGLLGAAGAEVSAPALRDALLAALTRAPAEFGPCEAQTADPAWPAGHPAHRFGFDGARLLGAQNRAPTLLNPSPGRSD